MSKEIENRVLRLISDACDVPATQIKAGDSIIDIGLDSLALTEMSLKLKKEFGIQGLEEEFDFVETVGDVLSVVEKAIQ